MSLASEDLLKWYVVHTQPKQENRADFTLMTLGIVTLNPKLRGNRLNQFTRRPIRDVKPLFPGYIFARVRLSEHYHKVRFSRGVHSLVGFNNRPIPVEDEVVELVRSRIGDDGFVRMHQQLMPGDAVVINDGGLQNLCGIFECDMPDAERVRILLSTVSFQAHVVVDRVLVNKVAPQAISLARYD